MRKLMFIILSIAFIPSVAFGQRNLLQSSYSQKFVESCLIKDSNWIKYPVYSDREVWQNLSGNLKREYIRMGEKYLHYNWPVIQATQYLEFSRSGDMQAMEKPFRERKEALESLTMAELIEGKGRFIDDIINGVFLYCEQTYWGSSAHFYMYGFTSGIENPITILPDIENPIVDLGVGEISNDLSWIWHFFHQEFDKVSPIISQRLKNEIKRKVLDPFYERNDYWWITGWGKGSVNNWNPWCNYNILNCILLIEDNEAKKIQGIIKTMNSVDLFLNSYKDDGGCEEGSSYWNVAGGKLFDYLDLLCKISDGKINIFDNELVKNIGRYVTRVYISDGCRYVNFADASPIIKQRAGVIYRYGQRIKDENLQEFGAFLLKKQNQENIVPGTMGNILEDLFNIEGWQKTQSTEILIPDFYFTDLQLAVGRDNARTSEGFFFAAKGGSNGVSHGHNDIGSGLLYYNGEPVLIDVGVGTYTKNTFSKQRFSIWTMQSLYHNLPVINGVAQKSGEDYKARNSTFFASKSKVSFSTDISGAYPTEADVDSWMRSYELERGRKFKIMDSFHLKKNGGNSQINFMTTLHCKLIKQGVLELKSDKFCLKMTYPSALSVHFENIKIDDNKLQSVWGNELTRIVYDIKSKSLKKCLAIEISKFDR